MARVFIRAYHLARSVNQRESRHCYSVAESGYSSRKRKRIGQRTRKTRKEAAQDVFGHVNLRFGWRSMSGTSAVPRQVRAAEDCECDRHPANQRGIPFRLDGDAAVLLAPAAIRPNWLEHPG